MNAECSANVEKSKAKKFSFHLSNMWERHLTGIYDFMQIMVLSLRLNLPSLVVISLLLVFLLLMFFEDFTAAKSVNLFVFQLISKSQTCLFTCLLFQIF